MSGPVIIYALLFLALKVFVRVATEASDAYFEGAWDHGELRRPTTSQPGTLEGEVLGRPVTLHQQWRAGRHCVTIVISLERPPAEVLELDDLITMYGQPLKALPRPLANLINPRPLP